LTGVVRHLVRPDKIAPPQLSRIEVQCLGEPIDNTVHDKHRLRATSAAVRRVRGLVGQHRENLSVKIGDAE